MMGAKKGGAGEFGSLLDLVDLLEDKAKYASKIQELDDRVRRAEAVLVQASENNRSAEDRRALAQQMLEQASQRVAEANVVRTQNEEAGAGLAQREKALADRAAAHGAGVAEARAALAEERRQHATAVKNDRKALAEERATAAAEATAADEKIAQRERAVVEEEAKAAEEWVRIGSERRDIAAQRAALVADQRQHQAKVEQLQKLMAA